MEQFWQWLIDTGRIEGNASHYTTPGALQFDEFTHALRTAWNSTDDAGRRQLLEQAKKVGALLPGDDINYYLSGGGADAAEFDNLFDAMARRLQPAEGATGGGPTPEQGELIEEIYGGFRPELWRNSDTGEWYLVYYVPDTDVPLLYAGDDTNLQALFPDGNPRFDRELTTTEIAQAGGLHAGQAEDPYGDPYAAFVEQLEVEAEIRPWLRDPDMVRIMFEAALEGRQVSPAELAQTEWWRNHNEAQRAWLILNNADPMTAAAAIESARINTRNQLEALGMTNVPDELVNALASNLVQGNWTEEYWSQQMRSVSDPFSDIGIDPEVQQIITGLGQQLDTASAQEERVREEVARWLGPVYGQWSDNQIGSWASRVRNDPDAFNDLTAHLRRQRLAMFPNYENEQLSYEDIAQAWVNLWENEWRTPADETDPFFLDLVRSEDYAEAQKKLRSEGLNRGVTAVRQRMEQAAASTANQIRRTF